MQKTRVRIEHRGQRREFRKLSVSGWIGFLFWLSLLSTLTLMLSILTLGAAILLFGPIHYWGLIAMMGAICSVCWVAAVRLWKQFYREYTESPGTANGITAPATIANTNTNANVTAPIGSSRAHWWTDNTSRDEIRQITQR